MSKSTEYLDQKRYPFDQEWLRAEEILPRLLPRSLPAITRSPETCQKLCATDLGKRGREGERARERPREEKQRDSSKTTMKTCLGQKEESAAGVH